MKKIFLIIIFFIFIKHAYAEVIYKEGKDFNTIKTRVIQDAKILEFFSFYCIHCYKFDFIYNINEKIKKNISQDIKIIQYHVDFLGGDMGKILTKAWAVAMALGLEEIIKPIIFKQIQKNMKFYNEKDLKKDFIKASGITDQKYDIVWNSFLVQSLIKKQQKAAYDINLTRVPTILINSRYIINNTMIINNIEKNLEKKSLDLMKFLLKK